MTAAQSSKVPVAVHFDHGVSIAVSYTHLDVYKRQGLIGAGNNPMVGMTVAVAVSIEEAAKEGKF